ncbi:hypothetical protein HY358_00550 [Candidatus Roizmanbacteria bacterium]|nr:hypothetical protein [Candidatus Roizmanbacteria bacterium]
MEVKNYTPINPAELEKKVGHTEKGKSPINMNTILLLIGTITAIVLAVMLFVLIQKKIQSQSQQNVLPPPALEQKQIAPPKPTVEATPTISVTEGPIPTAAGVIPSPTATASAAPVSSPSAVLSPFPSASLSPTSTATPSATRSP